MPFPLPRAQVQFFPLAAGEFRFVPDQVGLLLVVLPEFQYRFVQAYLLTMQLPDQVLLSVARLLDL